jgi:hypothetical protein
MTISMILSRWIRDNVPVYTSKEAIKYRKLIVKVTYTNDLKCFKNETVVNAIQVQLDSILKV